VVRADGTDPTCLTANLDDSIMDLAWSPDGLKIACITEPADYSRPDNLVVCHVQDQNCTRFTVRAFAVGGVGGYIAWSPDSNRLAIGYQPGVGLGKLVLVDLAENAVKPLPQPAGYRAPHPLWFPDGERIGFFATEEEQDAEPEFWILTLETRELERIVALPASEGRFSSGSYPQWLSESEILFYSDRALWSMRVDGSAPQRLTPGGLTIYLGRAPVVSPISHEMAFVTKEWFSVTSGAHASRIAILDLMDGQLDVK